MEKNMREWSNIWGVCLLNNFRSLFMSPNVYLNRENLKLNAMLIITAVIIVFNFNDNYFMILSKNVRD